MPVNVIQANPLGRKIEPDMQKPCRATLIIGIMIAEPLTNGTWRPIHVDNDSLGVILQGHNPQELATQVRQKIQEFKESWGNQIIQLEILQTDVPANQSQTEEKSSSNAPTAVPH